MRLLALILWCFALLLPAKAQEGFDDDGLYTITYNRLAFTLTQIGLYGELVITSAGYGDMRFGSCRYVYRRDSEGMMVEHSPPRARGTARCPPQIAFVLTPSEMGFYEISFSKGSYLMGQSYKLSPKIQRMKADFETGTPEGFDILGLAPAMSRIQVEERLKELGFSPHADWHRLDEVPQLYRQRIEVWGKGKRQDGTPEDAIGLAYSATFAGQEEELLLHISRQWHPDPMDSLSAAALRQSLEAKYGAPAKASDNRYFDRAGIWQPVGPICAREIQLQEQAQKVLQIGERGEVISTPACGAEVRITIQEGKLVDRLDLSLLKPDLLYADFWHKWSLLHALALESDYKRIMADLPPIPQL